jgi:diguanylate cyclase (GGDEF)-like protein/PAS domain S-box-containing protein
MNAMRNREEEKEHTEHTQEIVKILYASSTGAVLISLVVALIMMMVVRDVVSQERLLLWFSLFFTSYIARKLLAVLYHRSPETHGNPWKWLDRFRIATAFCGLSWGLAGVLLFPPGFVDQAFMSLVFAGVCGGAIIVYSIDRLSSYAFTAGLLVPALPNYFIHGDNLSFAIAVLLVLFVSYLLIAAFRNAGYLHESIWLRIEANKSRQAMNALAQRQKLHIENTPLAVIEWDPDFRVTSWNFAAEAMFGYPAAEALQQPISFIVAPSSLEIAETQCRQLLNGEGGTHVRQENIRQDGMEIHCEWFNTPIKNTEGKIVAIASLIQDVTAYKRAQDEIQRLAYYDVLTNLPNRRLLLDRLERTLISNTRQQKFGCIMFMDLDNFKTLNDTKGHAMGDMLLVEVANRLEKLIRGSDTVARIGGDEFVLVLENLASTLEQATHFSKLIADKVIQEINKPFHLGQFDHHCSPSIGISMFPDKNLSVDEILKRADTAMYQAKQAGRNKYRFFDESMQPQLDYQSRLKIEMQLALERGQFSLNLQPQVNEEAQVGGAEVLLRWTHPEYGNVSPGQFIPLAEESGLIIPIGNWVLRQACQILKAWESQPALRDLRLSVNVSALQLSQPDFVQQVRQALHLSGCSPSRLKLELTESMVIQSIDDIISKMTQLKRIGVALSLDDFGIGYSSLSILTRLPLDELKIDQSFVHALLKDQRDSEVIIQTIIAMGEKLGLKIIAEGVESWDQVRFLREAGCSHYQGYLFGRPMQQQQFEQQQTIMVA